MVENKICKNCKHFRQHYIKFGKSYRSIEHGHCVFPRLKKRETNEKACEHYNEQQKEEWQTLFFCCFDKITQKIYEFSHKILFKSAVIW